MIVEPYPSAILNKPLPPTVGITQSLSMWSTVGQALRSHRRPNVIEVMLPRTLPVLSESDLAPHHIIDVDGHLSLRKGAPPQVVKGAAADFAEGRLDLNDFLDRIGVPKQ